MPIRKLKADAIFDGYRLLQQHVLTIDEDGVVVSIERDRGENDLEIVEGILSPGFINCHCHTELSYLEGVIPEKTGLVDFVLQVMAKRNDYKDVKSDQINSAINAMWEEGIVAVGDICNTTDSVTAKKGSEILFRNFIEIAGIDPSIAEQRLEAGQKLLSHFEINLPQQPASLVPHAPYSVSDALFKLIAECSGDKIITIHNQESGEEDRWFRYGESEFARLYEKFGQQRAAVEGGNSSFHYWLPLLAHSNIISVHNTFTSAEDVDFFKRTGKQNLFFCLCPNANIYIENRLPDVKMLVEKNARIVIGTDSLASNHQLSIRAEINLLLEKFHFLKLEDCLGWATMNGAVALGFEDRLGSFEPGKRPGVVNLVKRNGEYLAAKI